MSIFILVFGFGICLDIYKSAIRRIEVFRAYQECLMWQQRGIIRAVLWG